MKHLLIMIATGIIFFGCSSSKNTTMNSSTAAVNATLTETYWKLTELMGQPISPAAEGSKEMFISLNKEGSQVFGNSGCNSFRGTYTLVEGTDRIHFSQMAGTMMACINMEKEKEFLDMLQKTDSYAILGNVLSFNRARMAPLARFVAVAKK